MQFFKAALQKKNNKEGQQADYKLLIKKTLLISNKITIS